ETPTEKPTEKEPPQPYFEQIPSEPEPAKPPIKKSQQRSNKPELLERIQKANDALYFHQKETPPLGRRL
ncbi:hypothetical protein KW791_00865, partial [Candidatus Parcubacteria bacterium]|nr:hypothetical protein [Candidatus Parcubacteria bacterium]